MPNEKNILKNLTSSDNAEAREAAFAAGHAKLKSAIPFLLKLIESNSLGVQEAAELALRQIRGPEVVEALIPLLESEEAPLRNIAMDVLREVGRDNIAPLKKLLVGDDPDLRIFIADILGSSGDAEAMAALCEALLKDPEVNVRYQAAMSLGNLGFSDAADALNRALEDEEWVQFSVIEALTKIRAESSILAMVKALDRSSELVASMIVEALGELGNIKAVPLLLKHIENASGPLRNKILQSIIKILGPKSLNLFFEKDKDKFKGYLIEALEDEDTSVQAAAVLGLSVVKGEDASLAVFKRALGLDPDRDHDFLEESIDALVKIGNSKALEEALNSSDEATSRLAVEVLARLDNDVAVELLKGIFWHKERNIQRNIISHFVELSNTDDLNFFVNVLTQHRDGDILKGVLYFFVNHKAPVEAREKIIELLEHKYEDIRRAALQACIAMGEEDMAPFFQARLNVRDDGQREMAVAALGSLDPQHYFNEIAEALHDSSSEVRCSALRALGSVHPLPEEYLNAMLETSFRDPDRQVRLAFMDVLGSSAEAEQYIDIFITALKEDNDDWVKARAVEALGNIRRDDIVPALAESLDPEKPLVAIKVIEALSKIGGEIAFNALLWILETGGPDLQGPAEEALSILSEDQGGAF